MSTSSSSSASKASGLGLLTVLQTDLRAISQEARTKLPAIKEASERAILKLKYLEENSPNTLISSLAHSEDVIKPFLLACDTKNQKMVSIAIGSILKLISHSAVSIATLPPILAKMAMLIDVGSEEAVQLKVLQGLLSLITTLKDLHEDLLAQCLVLCFRLHSSKTSNIQKTSYATLPQITRIIFDRVAAEMLSDQSSPQEDTTTSVTTTTQTTEDIATTTTTTTPAEESTSTLPTPPVATPPLTSSTPPSASPAVASSEPSSPSLGSSNRPPLTLKPCAKDAYLLLQDLCHITGGDNPAWLPPTTTIARSAGLELIEMIISVHSRLFTDIEEFKFLLKDRVCPLLIKSFKFKLDFFHTVRLMRIISAFIGKYAATMVTEADVLLTKSIRMMESDNPLWMQVLALESFKLYTEDPNLLRMFYRNYDKDNNAAKIFESMASSIGKYVQSLYTLDASHYVFQNTAKNRWDIFSQMTNSCWVSVLAAISMLLSKAADETLIQIVLKSLQSFTNTCGELHLSAPRDALLTCLCKTTVPQSTDTSSDRDSAKDSDGQSNDKSLSGSSETSSNMSSQSISSKSMRGEQNLQPSTVFYPTMKNILSVKTLLNIAHCMGSVLDEAWLLVLETLETWDRVLKTMHQSQDNERSLVSSPRVGQGEVSILKTAMDSLFKSSCQLDERSINFLFDALGRLCTNSLSKASYVNSPTNMFSIGKLVEASMSNLHRIDKLWGYISSHLIETGMFKNSFVRVYGVESLTLIVKTALSLPLLVPEDHEVAAGNGKESNEEQSATEDGGGGEYIPVKRFRRWNIDHMQEEFINTIEELSLTQFTDTKEKVLESIHQILSSSGHILSTAWPILLSILLRVAHNNERAFVPIAFESLKLICNEFLSNLSPECLVLTIEVICAFVSQKSDINISLTASSGLLSDLTYFLANESALSNSKYSTSTVPSDNIEEGESTLISSPKDLTSARQRPTIPSNSPFYVEKNRSVMNRMWLCAFTSMKILCIDQRPAIRNGVIVSLFQTLTTFLHLLDKDLIELILWRILFPLIEEVKQCSDMADKERIDSDLGGGVMLLVHHSRNTAQKQWDETQVLPIGRMIIVFKTFFDTLSTLPSFNKAWEKLLDILETECKSTSKEVSMASISSLHEIVNSNITDVSHVELCESVWATLLRLSTKLTDPTNSVPKTLSVYIKVFLDLFAKCKSTMTHPQMMRVIQIIYPLGLYIGESPTELSSPQTHIAQLVKSLPPVTEEIFPTLLTMLLKYISIGIDYTFAPTCHTLYPPVQITKDLMYYAPITERSMDLVCELFTHPSTTNTMRASTYEDIIKVFGAAMLTKYTKYHSNVWKNAVSSLIKSLPLGLLSINEDTGHLNDVKRNIIWTELIDTIQTFILHERPQGTSTLSPEKRSEEDRYDIDLINAISKEMVGFSGIRVERVSIIRDRLVEILYEGSMLSPMGREKVSQACYHNMFSICAKAKASNPESIEIAKIILPVILKRCKDVLRRFVVDERQSGQLPLPRLSEVSFILKEVQQLELQPGIYESENINNVCLKESGGKRPHLLELFTILSDCICTSEKEVKELLKNIFYIIAQEFLNLNTSSPSS
eukprot:gene165-195_t